MLDYVNNFSKTQYKFYSVELSSKYILVFGSFLVHSFLLMILIHIFLQGLLGFIIPLPTWNCKSEPSEVSKGYKAGIALWEKMWERVPSFWIPFPWLQKEKEKKPQQLYMSLPLIMTCCKIKSEGGFGFLRSSQRILRFQ